jgi:hypothetical protein
MIDPRRRLSSSSPNPIVVAVDVTGSMSSWPAEIFDRLPLFYNTLSQYRPDLEVLFAAIGDVEADRWPLQASDFARGYDLEQQLGAIYGEGGGGDGPESYGAFAWWLNHHVTTPNAKRPFCIVFGDAPMHEKVSARTLGKLFGDSIGKDVDALAEWKKVTQGWSAWFLRRPTGGKDDEVDQQWTKALGKHKCIRMYNEQRAVDYAMGIVARTWGRFEDFKKNMAARQTDASVRELEKHLDAEKVRALSCPVCAAPIPPEAFGRFVCSYCDATLTV